MRNNPFPYAQVRFADIQLLRYRVPAFDLEIGAEQESPYKTMEHNQLALQLYQISDFRAADDNVRIPESGINWEHHKPGYYAVLTNEGCCATDSNWLNYILRGDYEEVGYMATSQRDGGGHIFNYIKHEGFYYFIDLTHYRASDYNTAVENGGGTGQVGDAFGDETACAAFGGCNLKPKLSELCHGTVKYILKHGASVAHLHHGHAAALVVKQFIPGLCQCALGQHRGAGGKIIAAIVHDNTSVFMLRVAACTDSITRKIALGNYKFVNNLQFYQIKKGKN